MEAAQPNLLEKKNLKPWPKRKTRERSNVWKYFGFEADKNNPEKIADKGKVVCALCGKKLSLVKSSTSAMWNHLRYIHAEFFLEQSEKGAIASIKKDTNCTLVARKLKDPYHMEHPRIERLTKAITFYLAKSMQPHSIIEESAFRKMLQEFDNKYQMPPLQTFFKIHLPALYKEVGSRIISPCLKKAKYMALSSEVWTSQFNKQFLGIQAHIVDETWNMKQINLDIVEWNHPHDINHLKDVLHTSMDNWGISVDKVTAVTVDKAVDILKAGNLNDYCSSVPCFKNTITRVVQEGLGVVEVKALKEKCYRLSEIVNMSKDLDTELKVFHDVSRVSGSDWELVETLFAEVLAHEQAINVLLASCGENDLVITKDDVQILEDLEEIFKPLKDLSEEIVEQGAISAATIWPSFALLKTILSPLKIDGPVILQVKNAMFAKLQEYFDSSALQNLLSRICFLDPRFKALPFMNDYEKSEVCNTLTLEAKQLFPEADCKPETSANEPQKKKKKRSLASLFEGIIPQEEAKDLSSTDSTIKLEMQRYSNNETLPLSANPFQWWAHNAQRFPMLQQLAKRYLCVPASSVSYGGCTKLNPKQAMFTEDDVKHLIFLHDNMPDDFLDDKMFVSQAVQEALPVSKSEPGASTSQ